MTDVDPPPRKRSGEAPPRSPAAVSDGGIEPPFTGSRSVNEPLAWEAAGPAEPVPFDWATVERLVDGSHEESGPIDYAKRYLGVTGYLRDMAELAPQPGRLPTLKQSACNWLASAYVLQLPFVEGKSLRECAAAVGVSHEYFRHFVSYWAGKLHLMVPFKKAPATGRKIAAALTGRQRVEKEAA